VELATLLEQAKSQLSLAQSASALVASEVSAEKLAVEAELQDASKQLQEQQRCGVWKVWFFFFSLADTFSCLF